MDIIKKVLVLLIFFLFLSIDIYAQHKDYAEENDNQTRVIYEEYLGYKEALFRAQKVKSLRNKEDSEQQGYEAISYDISDKVTDHSRSPKITSSTKEDHVKGNSALLSQIAKFLQKMLNLDTFELNESAKEIIGDYEQGDQKAQGSSGTSGGFKSSGGSYKWKGLRKVH